ncbi:MAG TPA: esterase-like activity of phytase family protein [Gemmatimonadaceae bacterium]|jgi:hypothetical protein
MTVKQFRGTNARRFGAVVVASLALGCSSERAVSTAPVSAAPLFSREAAHDADALPSVTQVHVARLLPNDVIADINGVHVFNGGFGSALDASPFRSNEFYSMTDRGPNVSGTGNDKLFPVPDFHPQVGIFRLHGNVLRRERVIVLRDESGKPLTGLPPAGGGNTGEIPKTLDGSPLPNDPNGIDSEGLRVMRDGSFWVSDEYGPFIAHFDRHGRTIERDSPFGGPHPLPTVLARRQPNKGMEGLASIENGRILFGMMQNPLNNPASAVKNSKLLRLLVLNTKTGATKQLVYLMDDPKYGVSEIEAISPTRLLVDERDGKFFNDPAGAAVQKKIYLIDIAGATDVSDPANSPDGLVKGGKTLEQMSDADLATNGIVPVKKQLLIDLLAFGYTHDKAEGLTLTDGGRTVAVSNDDDFGVTDDGAGHLIQKMLPSAMIDHNEVWFFRLSKSLYAK